MENGVVEATSSGMNEIPSGSLIAWGVVSQSIVTYRSTDEELVVIKI